mmetsp:Transcript_49729/g.120544  ORF Transcript_49729/g.120544 Transcript_49729/m.120544 type:complete len:590 (-) Transcript_49729:1584-3353(-)
MRFVSPRRYNYCCNKSNSIKINNCQRPFSSRWFPVPLRLLLCWRFVVISTTSCYNSNTALSAFTTTTTTATSSIRKRTTLLATAPKLSFPPHFYSSTVLSIPRIASRSTVTMAGTSTAQSEKDNNEKDEISNKAEEDQVKAVKKRSSKVKGSTTKKAASPKTKKRKTKTKGSSSAAGDTSEELTSSGSENGDSDCNESTSSSPTKKKRKKTSAGGAVKAKAKKTKTTAKKKETQRITEIDPLPKLWNDEMAKANGSYTFKIASWNVAGLRAVVRKTPDALSELVRKYDLDMLCLQEHKLQDIHLDDPKLKLKGLLHDEGYDEYYTFSTAKKGYSGTAVFIRRRTPDGKTSKKQQKQLTSFFAPAKKEQQKEEGYKNSKTSSINSDSGKSSTINPEMLVPVNVSYELGKPIDNEGRTVIIDMPFATLVNVYVPNSGQKLERLDYRTKEWDKFFLEFIKTKQKERNLPVIWLGDLNIAHRSLDIWNDGASHLDKQAGVTPQERASFTEQLESGGFVDAFRRLHPDAKGNYSYWSQRAGNRAPNKGLRLDYFVCSKDMFDENANVVVRDSYMAMEQVGSDHGPVILELEIKP